MNSQEQREKFMRFLATLPAEALDQLSQKQIDAFLLVHDIAAVKGFVLYEVGNICEGVRRVLVGEDSPANLVAFISEDKNIEEDNRGKIPEIAQEIQTKIFDPVLPILKQAGMPVKEGRVATPAIPISNAKTTTPVLADSDTPFNKGDNTPPQSSPLKRGGGETLDERHLRALLRIAAGTTYAEEKLREAFEDLPQGLRQAITSVDTGNAVQDIAKKYMLHVDQMGALASETGLVLLGLTHPKNFVANLAKRLRVPEARALEIGKEISAEILSKVREALRGLHKEIYNNQETITKQGPISNIPNKTTTPQAPPWKGGEGMASVKKFGVLAAQKETVHNSKLEAISYQPKAGLATPYSPETKWNLGEVPSSPPDFAWTKSRRAGKFPAQLRQNEVQSGGQVPNQERLTREEVLRGIENPRAVPQLKTSPPAPRLRRAGNLQLETKVGPTGWRLPQQPTMNHETVSMEHEAEHAKQEIKEVEHFQTNSSAQIPTTPNPSLERRGGEKEPTANRFAPDASEEDLVEQKLSGPVSAPKTEHRYTTDPYREQIDQ